MAKLNNCFWEVLILLYFSKLLIYHIPDYIYVCLKTKKYLLFFT
jgi:hypothetical protein